MKNQVFTYNQFVEWVQDLVVSGKTSGDIQSPALVNFTALNAKRMSRLNKTIVLQPELNNLLEHLTEPQEWLVITEAWCGDSAQILPVLAKIASVSNKISLKVVLRDENPGLMDKYLTNSSRSIPKLVSKDAGGNDLFNWGPRPEPAQKIFMDWKKEPAGRDWNLFERELHSWYTVDKSLGIQKEFVQIFKNQEMVFS